MGEKKEGTPFPDGLDPKSQTILDFTPLDRGMAYIAKDMEKELGSFKNLKYNSRIISIGPVPISSKKGRKMFIKSVRDDLKKRKAAKYLDSFKGKEIFVPILYCLGKKYAITDLDNLTKNLLDAIKNVVIGDDSEIVKLHTTKQRILKDPKEKDGEKWRTLLESTIVGISIY